MKKKQVDPAVARAAATKRYYARMKRLGYKRLSVWVPEHGRAEFEAAYAALMEKWEQR